MSNYITRNLRQIITRYQLGAADGFGGYSYTKSIIKGRWENKQQLVIDKAGNQVVSETVVYLDTPVTLGDWLFLGSLTAAIPTTTTGAKQVIAYREIPNLSNTMSEKKAYL